MEIASVFTSQKHHPKVKFMIYRIQGMKPGAEITNETWRGLAGRNEKNDKGWYLDDGKILQIDPLEGCE